VLASQLGGVRAVAGVRGSVALRCVVASGVHRKRLAGENAAAQGNEVKSRYNCVPAVIEAREIPAKASIKTA